MTQKFLAFLSTAFLLFTPYADACSTLALPNSPQRWVMKSYDWHQGHGRVIVNPRGLVKEAFHLQKLKLAKWTSKYGSVTFNQHGRELPLGGINEAGLVIEVMWLKDSEYSAGKSGEFVNELQWIQYHLDRFASVKEVVENAQQLGIASIYAKVHFMACDADGACATFDFLEGKAPVIHEGSKLTVPVLTNDTYARSIDALKEYEDFGGTRPAPDAKATGILERFVKGAISTAKYKIDTKTPTEDVFSILSGVSQGDYTQFNIAYDRKAKVAYFHTQVRPKVKSIDLAKLDFRCSKNASALDMNLDKEGDVTDEFKAHTKEANLKLVEEGLKEITKMLPEGAIEKIAAYPDTFNCE